jgi:hypothetical protein
LATKKPASIPGGRPFISIEIDLEQRSPQMDWAMVTMMAGGGCHKAKV